MARVIMVLIGAVLLGLGLWLGDLWWFDIKHFLAALLVILLVLLGIAVLIFGLSEIAGTQKKAPEPPAGE